jgi:hypothetical protein
MVFKNLADFFFDRYFSIFSSFLPHNFGVDINLPIANSIIVYLEPIVFQNMKLLILNFI